MFSSLGVPAGEALHAPGASPRRTGFSNWEQRLLAVLFCALGTIAQAQVIEIDGDGVTREVGAGWPPATAAAPSPQAFTAARYAADIRAAARRYALSPALLDALARSESNYDASAVSPRGAIGIMQLMPATARALGVDPRDPAQNILGGAAYLHSQLARFDGRIDLALAAYNAGDGAVRRYDGIPPFAETRRYVGANLERLAAASLSTSTSLPATLTPQGERP